MAVGQTLFFDIIGRETASTAFARAGAAADAASTRIVTAGKKMTAVGASMSKKITLPVVALGVASGKMATDFDSAMTRIQTQAGASARDVKVLTDQVLQLAGKAQQSPLELANSLYHLKSVGLDNAKAMKALKESSDLAAVGNADLEQTTNALAGAWRTGIRGAGNFKHAVSTLNAIIGAGNMTMSDLNGAIGTGFLPAAKSFGLSLKDVGSALAVMTDEGIPADAAATRLRMTFSLLGAPSEKAAKLLGGIGINAKALAKEMRTNGLVGAIGMLKDHLAGLSKVDASQLISRAFGGGRSSAAIMTLLNNFDVLQMKEEQVTKGMDRFGAAVAKQSETPQAKFKLLISTLEVAAVKIGNQLLPATIKAADALNSFVGWFSKLSSPVKQAAGAAVLFLAALGPVLAISGRLVTAYGLYIRTLEKMGVVQRTTAAATTETTAAQDAQAASAGRMSAAMAGLRLGAGIAGITALGVAAKTSNGNLKMLASVGGGALLGFSVGGPIGAAVGAGAGAIYQLTRNMGGAGSAAQQARSNFSKLGGTLDALTGSITADTRKFVENQLATSGSLKALASYGISTREAINAVLDEGNARKTVSAALRSQTSAIADQRRQIALLTAANVADQKNGTLTPQAQAARKKQIDAYNAQIAAEQRVAATVRAGIGMTRQQIAAKRMDIKATEDLTGKLKGIPKSVRTKLVDEGIYPTIKGVAEVARKYHLLPKQIRTVLTAVNVAGTVKSVEAVEAKLRGVSKTKADLSAYEQSLRAGSHTAQAASREVGLAVQHDLEGGPKGARANLSAFQQSLVAGASRARELASAGGHSVGAALSSGVATGIATNAADAAAAALVRNAIAAARHAAQAHSPSRKMVALGKDLMDGLVKGIDDHAMSVQKAMTRVQALISKVGSNISKLLSVKAGFARTFQADSIFSQDFSHTVANAATINGVTVSQGDDVTTPGTIKDILAFQKEQQQKARGLRRDVTRVTKMGLSKALIRQLEAQGASGAATLHALAQGDPSQIRRLNQLNKQTSEALRAAGMRAGNYQRGGSINADIRIARKQEHVLTLLEHHLRELAKSEKKGETIVVQIDSEAIIRAVHRRNTRKGVKSAHL